MHALRLEGLQKVLASVLRRDRVGHRRARSLEDAASGTWMGRYVAEDIETFLEVTF